MIKSLLFLGLLTLAGHAGAQTTPPPQIGVGRWTVVNTTNVTTAATFAVADIHTVSPNVAWGLTYDTTVPNPVPADFRFKNKTFVRTNNAAGTEFYTDNLGAAGIANAAFEGANIEGIDGQTAVAAMFRATAAGGGQILRTSNGGVSWTAVQGNGFAGPAGFNNWVHMFDASVGVSFGDPNAGPGSATPYFEVLRTTDGGLTWTRIPASSLPAPAPAPAVEGGLVRSYFALRGTNTIWASTSQQQPVGPCRILKSTDAGLTWAAYDTPLTNQIDHIAFKDALNGIAFNTASSPGNPPKPGTINLIRTTDGGVSWAPITPINSATGKFYATDIDAVPAAAGVPGFFVSAGNASVPNASSLPDDAFGSSTSLDGITWKDIDNAILVSATRRRVYLCLSVISNTAGYAGGFFEQTTGAGGIYKVNAVTPLPTRFAIEKTALGAYPNPSTGVFQLQLENGLKTLTQLTVTDVLGRTVYRRQLTPSAASSEVLSVDLTQEKPGVYTMELRNEAGVSQKKVVIQ